MKQGEMCRPIVVPICCLRHGYSLAGFASTSASTPAILKPADGTHIAPGDGFDFSYSSIADYGVSSYNYTVYLFTSPPSLGYGENLATGHNFGRFAQPNYPGNPNPPNPPPAQLRMPDFNVNRGFGSGSSATNATFYLAVFEEYANGIGSVGNRMSFVTNKIIYNATKATH
ncbi:hypothetical protein C8R43DRAFT_1011686 [Mycena crocata]|nr:hypothetical protein C8R43DRAFT_1011686 [Mycena crocata]